MKVEILSMETAETLARVNKVLNYIDSTLKSAYMTTLKNGVKYRLSYDAVMELQTIESMLKGNKQC